MRGDSTIKGWRPWPNICIAGWRSLLSSSVSCFSVLGYTSCSQQWLGRHSSRRRLRRLRLSPTARRFSNPQGCTSDDSLTPPDLVVSSAQTGEVLTVRVGDQILVADSESPLFERQQTLCLLQTSDPGGSTYVADRTGTTTIYIARPGRLSVVDIKVIPAYNELPGFLLMGLGAASLIFGFYVLSKTRRRSEPKRNDLLRADDAQTGQLNPNYGREGADAVTRSFPTF